MSFSTADLKTLLLSNACFNTKGIPAAQVAQDWLVSSVIVQHPLCKITTPLFAQWRGLFAHLQVGSSEMPLIVEIKTENIQISIRENSPELLHTYELLVEIEKIAINTIKKAHQTIIQRYERAIELCNNAEIEGDRDFISVLQSDIREIQETDVLELFNLHTRSL